MTGSDDAKITTRASDTQNLIKENSLIVAIQDQQTNLLSEP